jgi:hypothetical protein
LILNVSDLCLVDEFFASPSSLTHLTFSHFDSVNDLPHTITHFTTSYEFNLPVDKLPSTLTHLTTGDYFNQLVDKLPPTLTHLTTGDAFDQLVITFYPHSLTSQLETISANQWINSHPH